MCNGPIPLPSDTLGIARQVTRLVAYTLLSTVATWGVFYFAFFRNRAGIGKSLFVLLLVLVAALAVVMALYLRGF